MKGITANLMMVFVGIFCFTACQQNKNTNNTDFPLCKPYKSGDLVFVSADTSRFDNAVVNVTDGNHKYNFSHVGLLNCTDSGLFVIEAVFQGVVYTPMDVFMTKNASSKIQIARIKPEYQKYIPKAIQIAYSHLGKEYDFAFDFNNDSYYCSELVYNGFVEASGDSLFFETPPMTFKSANSDEFHPYWVSYFRELQVAIPEGEPGLNPNIMSRSDKLDWID